MLVEVEKLRNGWWRVRCNLGGLTACGRNLDEASAKLDEKVEALLREEAEQFRALGIEPFWE